MLKGGYQIIDLENRPLSTSVGMVYEGIYDKIEGTRKPILLSGIVIDGNELKDMFVNFGTTGTQFKANVSPIYTGKGDFVFEITVTDSDVVTVKLS